MSITPPPTQADPPPFQPGQQQAYLSPAQGAPVGKAPNGFGLAALLVGIGAFLVGLVPVLGLLCGIAALVLGVLALRKQQSKGMAITGIILGSVAALASIGITFGITAAVNNASSDTSASEIAESSSPDAEESTAPLPAKTEEPAEETAAPEPAAPAVPAEYASALVKAGTYSEIMSMSKAGIYDQLTSEYGEQFSPEASQYAVDNVEADWNANALAKAKTYQEQMAMSPAAIRDQLISEYGEKFTPEQADFAIQNLNG